MIELKMPKLAQTSTEYRVSAWVAKEGDRIEKGDVLLEVEIDKATAEVESYVKGTLAEIVIGEDETVNVGDVYARIEEA